MLRGSGVSWMASRCGFRRAGTDGDTYVPWRVGAEVVRGRSGEEMGVVRLRAVLEQEDSN